MADVFISYAREDTAFARELHAALASHGKDAWVDWEGIIPTDEWRVEIRAAIEAAHTFVFVISPASVHSAMCLEELSFAVDLKRRLTPVKWSEVADALVPQALQNLQWIILRPDEPHDGPLNQLMEVVDKDLPWLRLDRRLHLRAREWQQRGRDATFLLTGIELLEGQNWLTQGVSGERRPSELQTGYIAASAAAARERQSNRLAEQSRRYISGQQDLALLLSVEAVRRANTVPARAGLLAALQAHPFVDTWLRTPDASISTVAFSPDGRLLAAGTVAGYIYLWDVASRQMRGKFTPYETPVAFDRIDLIIDCVSFSPDGNMLAIAIGAWVVLWHLPTNTQVGPIESTHYPVTSVAFSRDGEMLFWGSTDKAIRLMRLRSAHFNKRSTISFDESSGETLTGHTARISALAISPDGSILASSGEEKTVRFWDVANKVQIAELMFHGDSIPGIAFNPAGTLLASGSFDGTAILWDVAQRKPWGKPMAHDSSGITGVAFDATGKTLASTARDGSIALWDVQSQNRVARLTGHDGKALRIAFSPSASLLASAGNDGAVIVWDAATRSPLARNVPMHKERVCRIGFSPDGKSAATGAWDGCILLSGWAGSKAPTKCLAHNQKITWFAFSPDSSILASSTFGWLIRLWDVASGDLIGELAGHSGKVQSLAFSPVANLLASASWDQSVRLWDVATRQPAGEPLQHEDQMFCVAISPDGTRLAAGGKDSNLVIWGIDTHQRAAGPFKAHSDAVTTATFHPQGGTLVSGSSDGSIQFWDAGSWRARGEPLQPDAGLVYEVAFSPDGGMLASAHSDGSVRLWDVATMAAIGELRTEHRTEIYSVAFSPNGHTLLAGGCSDLAYQHCESGLVMSWDVSQDSWISHACRMANRNLSHQEWQTFLGNEEYRATCGDRS
jgi:WD40 repeat protein